MGPLPLGSDANLGGVALVLACLVFLTALLFASTKDATGLGRWVLRVWVLCFDVWGLIVTFAHYGDLVWFPSD